MAYVMAAIRLSRATRVALRLRSMALALAVLWKLLRSSIRESQSVAA